MKRILPLPILLLFTAALHGQQILINQDFESLNAGGYVAQGLGLPWTTWSNTPGSAEDAVAVDASSFGGSMCMGVIATSVDGGPTDFILRLGNRTSGNYVLAWQMYIPSGKGGYFNVQKAEAPGTGWAIEISFLASGDIAISSNGTFGTVTNYPHDQWFLVGVGLNLNAMAGALTIDGGVAATWNTSSASGTDGAGLNQFGGLNFFSYGGGTDMGEYYVDDLAFMDISGLGVAESPEPQAVAFPNPTSGRFTVDAAGFSASALLSVVDITGRTVVAPTPLLRRGAMARAEADLSGLPDGSYFVRIQEGERQLVRRVTKH